MADKSSDLMLAALTRAATDPAGVPLFAGRADAGLFPATAAAKSVAKRCLDDGLLAVVGSAGKRGDVCRVTPAGIAKLHAASDPKPILEDFLRTLEDRRKQADELLAAARQMTESLTAMSTVVGGLLPKVTAGRVVVPVADDLTGRVLTHLADWAASAVGGQDCPLPELFRAVSVCDPSPTVGRFHDVLRALHEARRIYLHPWTGPLYTLPEPGLALLVGHEVSYYASAVTK